MPARKKPVAARQPSRAEKSATIHQPATVQAAPASEQAKNTRRGA